MNLQPYQDLQQGDTDGFEDFLLALQLNHNRIAQAMFTAGNVYNTYPLIVREAGVQDWQQTLQQELQSIYTLNGLNGLPDLSGSDLSQPEDFETFMQLLIQVEARINSALGIV